MQGSKIDIGTIYAIKRDERLMRFLVTAVVTTRRGKHATDHSHIVHGYVVEDNKVEGEDPKFIGLKPEALLGEYTKHAELVARSKAEADAKQAKINSERSMAIAVADWLADMAGVARADHSKQFGDDAHVMVQYGATVHIGRKVVEKLYEKLLPNAVA